VRSIDVELTVGSPELEIRYWKYLDRFKGSIHYAPDQMTYKTPIHLDESATIYAQCFYNDEPVSPRISQQFSRVLPWHPDIQTELKVSGITRKIYKGSWDVLPDFSAIEPTKIERVDGIDQDPEGEQVAWVYEGYLLIDSNDMYEFALSSDDGSRLLIDGIVVVDNDGLHGTKEESGSAPLGKGWHNFRLEWFNKTGGATLNLRMGILGGALHSIQQPSFAPIE